MLGYAVVLFVAGHCLTDARGGVANKGILEKCFERPSERVHPFCAISLVLGRSKCCGMTDDRAADSDIEKLL